jgi:CheY-like chemotaxis protein
MPSGRARKTPRAILLVDVDRNQRRSLAIGLRLLGHRPQEATSGEEAVARIRERAFDLIVVDLLLPDMSGLELARLLRQAVPGARVVVTSPYEVPARTLEALGFRPTAYLAKPLRTEALANLLTTGESSPL